MGASKQAKGKRGRPATPNRADIVAKVCATIAEGTLVKDACALHGVAADTLRTWAAETPELSALYARAREAQAHAWAEKALAVAEGEDATTQAREQAIEEYADQIAGDTGAEQKIRALESNLIQRDKLRVDTLKWMASKLAPKLYGEKVQQEISGPDGGPVPVSAVITWGGVEIPL